MKYAFEQKQFVIASDPTAFSLKEQIKAYFEKKGYIIEDVGTCAENEVAYYDAGSRAAEAVQAKKYEFGIVLCGSGMGVCLAANRIPGIYCAVCETIHTAKLSRVINNANMLALGASIVAPDLAINMVEAFIHTEFLEGKEGGDRKFLESAVEEIARIEEKAIKQYR